MLINFNSTTRKLIPISKQKNKISAFLYLILHPLKAVNILFDQYKTDTNYKLIFNGQIVYLEHYLNDIYDNTQRRIYIQDTANAVYNYININEAITIYPNPNNGTFSLSVELPYYQNIEYTIFDAVGKQISNNKVEHILQQNFSVNLNNQAKGVYYLRINTDLGQVTKQISIIK